MRATSAGLPIGLGSQRGAWTSGAKSVGPNERASHVHVTLETRAATACMTMPNSVQGVLRATIRARSAERLPASLDQGASERVPASQAQRVPFQAPALTDRQQGGVNDCIALGQLGEQRLGHRQDLRGKAGAFVQTKQDPVYGPLTLT